MSDSYSPDDIFTPQEKFRFFFDRYYPEFIERLKNDTLQDDVEFIQKSQEIAQLARDADIDISDYTNKYAQEHGWK